MGKVRKHSDSESDDGEIEFKKPRPAKKKKVETKTAEKSNDNTRDAKGDAIFALSNKRRVTVRAFPNGEPAIDIRETYVVNGEQRPGKGICLPLVQWKKLVELLPDIEEAITALPKKK
ncbi:hypothetical protein INT48_009763 [Thamnidium elegans]|uniref:Transcriptional coactivator p15 (PC4) C-terminal domain-containing protein n=1 Tax=Thamnidium elegans TaxID=101142 RepID=A0A8H7SPQ6_9FUNG|nr:hypothetical protein INT48_009763 [Thamnidium elegans]